MNFIISALHPILGADFFNNFGQKLVPYIKNRKLVDPLTKIHIPFIQESTSCTGISALPLVETWFDALFSRFPNIVQSSVALHTLAPFPVSSRPQRLSPSQLQAAKAELETLLELCICRPSSSPWANFIRTKSGIPRTYFLEIILVFCWSKQQYFTRAL